MTPEQNPTGGNIMVKPLEAKPSNAPDQAVDGDRGKLDLRESSIYPAVQNILLVAHCSGLGNCLTIHDSTPTRGEPEVKRVLGNLELIKVSCLIT